MFWKFLLLILQGIMVNLCLSKPKIATSDNAINSNDGGYSKYVEQYATQMLSYMNMSVQPCDDFYEYACGNWKHTIKERQSEKRRVNLGELVYKVDELIEAILQRSDIDDVAPEYAAEFELAKKLHRQCIDAELYPTPKSAKYLEIIQNIGGFPALDARWNASQFSWVNMSAHMSNYGVKNLINEQIYSRYPFPPLFLLPTFGFDIELHYDSIGNLSSNECQLNRMRMHSILALYDVTEDQIEHIIADIFVFLKVILNVLDKFEGDERKCENLARELYYSNTIKQQWMAYFDIAWMGKTVELGGGHGPCMFFYHELNKIAEQHKEAMANYLSLKFLYHMDARLKDPKFQKEYCTTSIKNALEFFFDHLYMKIYINKDVSEDVTKMGKEIQQSFRIILEEADWMDESTREAALLKESTIELFVGRYEDTETTKRLISELKNLNFVEGSYENNTINLQRFKANMTRYYNLHEEHFSNKTRPMVFLIGMEVNAFYYLADNNMYVQAGVMQPPTYHEAWPNSLKYGTLGSVLGHEFAHSVDTMGALIDHTGRLNYWWSYESGAIFNDRAECFKDFYNNYTVPEINRNINGKRTQDENIADVGGLRMALMAYRRYEKDEIKKLDSTSAFYKKEQMPGLDLSPEQLLFLGAAQIWCSSFNVANYWQELEDNHTIDKYRVLGMVTNNEDFAKIYNCPMGSNMNPAVDKCQIL